MIALDKIGISEFQPLLNQKFIFKISNDVSLEAELVEIMEFNGFSPLERKPFSVTFRTNQKNEYYEQGTICIVHPALGEIFLFLSPKGFDGLGMKYEAVFS